MNETLNAIAERSSTRGYTEQKLTKEEVDTLAAAALQAPTAANKQEIHVTVLNGGDPLLAEIEDVKNQGMGIHDPQSNFYFNAPTVMILSGDASFYWSSLDAGIAVENIAIAAQAMGLGSLIIGCIKDALCGEKKEYFAGALKFPEGYEFKVAIALGHKSLTKDPHAYSAEENVTYL